MQSVGEFIIIVYVAMIVDNKEVDIVFIFVKRLEKLGIKIELGCNYPWIYVDYINGKRVTEKFQGNHGFTIAFMPIRKDQEIEFTDIDEIFKLIRKYGNIRQRRKKIKSF